MLLEKGGRHRASLAADEQCRSPTYSKVGQTQCKNHFLAHLKDELLI